MNFIQILMQVIGQSYGAKNLSPNLPDENLELNEQIALVFMGLELRLNSALLIDEIEDFLSKAQDICPLPELDHELSSYTQNFIAVKSKGKILIRLADYPQRNELYAALCKLNNFYDDEEMPHLKLHEELMLLRAAINYCSQLKSTNSLEHEVNCRVNDLNIDVSGLMVF